MVCASAYRSTLSSSRYVSDAVVNTATAPGIDTSDEGAGGAAAGIAALNSSPSIATSMVTCDSASIRAPAAPSSDSVTPSTSCDRPVRFASATARS